LAKKIIGIDFSLNSPAWCVLSKDGAKWGSFHRTDKKIDKMLVNPASPFKVFSEDPHFSIKIIEKQKAVGEYWEVERKKIENFVTIADHFVDMIKPHIDENTSVFMEGISFGSSGNSLIDISMCTALTRERLINIVGYEGLNIYSPTAIKKFALKGNSKKDELYVQLLDKYKDSSLLEPIIKPLKQNQDLWIKKSKDVETPCSDLIDATWISLYGMSILGETF
jgi:hypothetical protein